MLSIVVVNYKNPALLRLSLSSIRRTIRQDFEHEIIVIDSASAPATAYVVTEEFPTVQLRAFKRNIGYSRGVNEGIKASKGDYVLILNPDIVPTRGSIESLYEYMKSNPAVGLAGPRLLNFDGSPQQTCFRYYSLWDVVLRRTFLGSLPFGKQRLNHFLMKDRDISSPLTVDWLMGSALIVSKSAIQRVGLMDESLFMYFSDVDWPRRFWQAGYNVVYYPNVEMYHYHHRESKGKFGLLDAIFNRQTRWHIRDAFRYFKKYGITNNGKQIPNYK